MQDEKFQSIYIYLYKILHCIIAIIEYYCKNQVFLEKGMHLQLESVLLLRDFLWMPWPWPWENNNKEKDMDRIIQFQIHLVEIERRPSVRHWEMKTQGSVIQLQML